MLAVDVEALSKVYAGRLGKRGQAALSDVSLRIPRGIAFGLIGLNGAGKTTLVKILLDVTRPSSGSVRVLGDEPASPAVRARVGYMPERLYMPPRQTPLQVLASVARLRRLGDASDEIRRQLARVGLGGDARRRIGEFSKGMRQRLGLAAALLGAPDLIILDEPTDGVDPLGRIDVRAVLREELDRGATILLNSHLLAETERLCDRIGVLAGGRLLREGSLRELCGSPASHRVRFARTPDAATLEALGFRASAEPGLFTCEASDPAALNDLLDGARRAGAEIVELGPDLRSLEDLLEELVGRQ